MRENDFKENKVILLIVKQFWSISHLILLDWLTPQDVYYIAMALVRVSLHQKILQEKNQIHSLSFISLNNDDKILQVFNIQIFKKHCHYANFWMSMKSKKETNLLLFFQLMGLWIIWLLMGLCLIWWLK